MNKIVRHICREGYISRVPGFFPYVNPTDGSTHSSSDSPSGSYNQIPLNLWDESFKSVIKNDNVAYYQEHGVPYRMVMDIYYDLIRSGEAKKDFMGCIENGIGRVKVDLTEDEAKDLRPDYVYLAQVPMLIKDYQTKSVLCKFYKQLIGRGEEPSATICCTCEKYERMGGDVMLTWLEDQLAESEKRSEEWVKRGRDVPTLNLSVPIFSKAVDMGTVRPLITVWEPKLQCYQNMLVFYEDKLFKAKTNGPSSKWNPSTRMHDFNISLFEELNMLEDNSFENNVKTVIYHTNSKLKTCRRPMPYVNIFGETEAPQDGEDWLYYYRLNQPVNIEYEADSNGNLVTTDGKTPTTDNLLIYGDVITKIIADKEKSTITFEYYIGARLKLKDTGYILHSQDDDNNDIYRLSSEAEYDVVEYTGVHYTETYHYVDEDTTELVKGGDFENYLNGLGNDFSGKYPFVTSGSRYTYETSAGMSSVQVTDILSTTEDYPNTYTPSTIVVTTLPECRKIEEGEEPEMADVGVPYIRDNYNLGVAYAEKVKSDVFVRRGVTNVFERHFKLAEIKTLEDMENYANGGFFNMQSS